MVLVIGIQTLPLSRRRAAPSLLTIAANRYLDCKRDKTYLKQTRSGLRLLRPRY
jgi:hypothetical protein